MVNAAGNSGPLILLASGEKLESKSLKNLDIKGRPPVSTVIMTPSAYMTNVQASLDRDIFLKALNRLFKETIEIYLMFLGIAYIKMCHDRQLSAVLAPVTSYACTACSGELI